MVSGLGICVQYTHTHTHTFLIGPDFGGENKFNGAYELDAL